MIFASHNQGKVGEVAELLQVPQLELLSLDEVGLADFEVEETGTTFEENALLKAQTVAEKTKLPTIADDSGLVVDALNGAPGVYSARFVSGSDTDRNQEVLKRLQNVSSRKAHFISVFCWYDPATQEKRFFEGRVDGQIAQTAQGSLGFGYDPIFIPEGYSQSFAQLGPEVKNKLSHRARAVEQLKEFFYDR